MARGEVGVVDLDVADHPGAVESVGDVGTSASVPWRCSRNVRIASPGAPSRTSRPWSSTIAAVAHLAHGGGVVGDEHDRPSLGLELLDPAQALGLEQLVADGEHLVDEQHVGVEVDGHGEPEAHVHARRVVLDRLVDELLQLGEGDDLVEAAVDLLARHAVERGVDVDVLAAGQLGVEAGAELEQRRQPAARRAPARTSA